MQEGECCTTARALGEVRISTLMWYWVGPGPGTEALHHCLIQPNAKNSIGFWPFGEATEAKMRS